MYSNSHYNSPPIESSPYLEAHNSHLTPPQTHSQPQQHTYSKQTDYQLIKPKSYQNHPISNKTEYYDPYYSPPKHGSLPEYTSHSHTNLNALSSSQQHSSSSHLHQQHHPQTNNIHVNINNIQNQFQSMQLQKNETNKFRAKSVPDMFSDKIALQSLDNVKQQKSANSIQPERYPTDTLLGFHRKYLNKMKIYYGTKYLEILLKSSPSTIAIDCEGTNGKFHPALIQIAVDSLNGIIQEPNNDFKEGKLNCDSVYVFKLNRTVLHHIHSWLLDHSNMIKVVFAGADDTKTFPGIKNVVDVQHTIKKLWNEKYGVNLAKCYGFECCNGTFLRKNKSLSKSNWFQKQLTWDQIEYAALDAWATLELYQKLLKKFFVFVS
jgi:hypothetical protein